MLSAFFEHSDGATPRDLLRLGIYDRIAVPLQGGYRRRTGVVMAALEMGAMLPSRQFSPVMYIRAACRAVLRRCKAALPERARILAIRELESAPKDSVDLVQAPGDAETDASIRRKSVQV